MIRKGLMTALLGLPLLGALPAEAQFLAADLIYVPAAAHTSGEGTSEWRSDFFISNVEGDVAIDVALVFLPSGLTSNAFRFTDRSTWLGGRESDGFGNIDPLLADIPAGGTIVLRDPIGNYFLDETGAGTSGGFVIFAYEANTLEDDGTRVLKNAIVNTRVYTPTVFYRPDPVNEGEFIQETGTYGQTLPGVPWYNLADPSAHGIVRVARLLDGDDHLVSNSHGVRLRYRNRLFGHATIRDDLTARPPTSCNRAGQQRRLALDDPDDLGSRP